jgi:hypothetical protein
LNRSELYFTVVPAVVIVPKKLDPERIDAKAAKALAEAQTARRRATMALAYVKEMLKYSPTHPRIETMVRNIEKEFLEG